MIAHATTASSAALIGLANARIQMSHNFLKESFEILGFLLAILTCAILLFGLVGSLVMEFTEKD